MEMFNKVNRMPCVGDFLRSQYEGSRIMRVVDIHNGEVTIASCGKTNNGTFTCRQRRHEIKGRYDVGVVWTTRRGPDKEWREHVYRSTYDIVVPTPEFAKVMAAEFQRVIEGK